MISKVKVTEIVNEWLVEKEYFLVDVTVSADNCVSVEIDHADGVWIEDCVQLSKHIEANLDREVEDYELEVGSAGI
jgi:ribosome maturation factor RimP